MCYKFLVFAQTSVGGAERMSVTITKTLDEGKYNLKYYLVGPTFEGRAPLADFIPNKFCVKNIDVRNPFYLIVKLYWILRSEKPDIVFSSVLNLNDKILFISSLFKKTKFIVRCDNYLYTYSDKQRNIIARTYRRANVIIAQTEEMKKELIDELKISETRVVVLQNPVDAETIDSKLADAPNPYPHAEKIRYTAVGRFSYQKGFDLLVKAFASVKKLQPYAELYIIGKKDTVCEEYYQEVKRMVDGYCLQDSIHCVGFQTNPYVYIKYSDCLVLSSRWEGLPNVIIESLYIGTPVAAFKCVPIIERIIKNGQNGFLADKENVESLAKAMINASRLNKINTDYKSASVDDFHHIFDCVVRSSGGGEKN